MTDDIKPEYFILLIMLPPALGGAYLAHNRGRNKVVWAALCAIFPIFLMVIFFEKPLREVPGGFKRCTGCGQYVKWKVSVCKYCNATLLGSPLASPGDQSGLRGRTGHGLVKTPEFRKRQLTESFKTRGQRRSLNRSVDLRFLKHNPHGILPAVRKFHRLRESNSVHIPIVMVRDPVPLLGLLPLQQSTIVEIQAFPDTGTVDIDPLQLAPRRGCPFHYPTHHCPPFNPSRSGSSATEPE